MASKGYVFRHDIYSARNLELLHIDDFLNFFKPMENLDLHKGTFFNIELKDDVLRQKINPILIYAEKKDASKIAQLFKEGYDGTYPYKEYEEEQEIKKMIKSGKYKFVLFKTKLDEIIGMIKFLLDFKAKRGYSGGLVVKKKYRGKIDVVKAYVGSLVLVWSTYKNEVGLWYGEARTAHSKVQYLSALCSAKPIGFYPNKDVFLNKTESDLMLITYNQETLNRNRRKDSPRILPEIVNCFLYADNRYDLGSFELVSPEINLDHVKLTRLQKNIKREIKRHAFGYETIKLSYEGTSSSSYLKFLYTPQVQNFEKTEYKVDNMEELFIFVQEFKRCARELEVRYCEAFVSAYEPEHQRIFLDLGLTPRGYIPSWQYDQDKGCFEDYVLFNYYEGKIDQNIQLIEEGIELIRILKIDDK
ncbi:MAG: hypothetical protein ACTSUT_15215 [Promethearchaeota archaeon]